MKFSPALFTVFALTTSLHAADEPAKEANHLRKIRQITFDGSRNGEGYFSRDGRQIVFQATRSPENPHEEENPFYQIFSLDLRDGALKRVTSGLGKTTCAFFRPDGKRMLFASTHLDPNAAKKQREETDFLKSGQKRRYEWDFDDHYDIFDAKPDGSDVRRLTEAVGYDAEASYSPDGKRICFMSNRDGDREIYVMDADGKNPRRLTQEPGYDGGPFFSPDGKWIVYRHFTPDDTQAEVMLMRADGSEKAQVTRLGAMSWSPYFHPTGRWIVFCSNKDGGFGNFELYLVRPDGRDLTRITFTEGFDGLPVFSPDGKKLMWTSTRAGGKSQLFIADFVDPDSEAKPVASPSLPVARPINADRVRRDIEFLASPVCDGRRTGTEGERKAAAYIEQQLRAAGLRDIRHQAFSFPSSVALGANNSLETSVAGRGELNQDFVPLALSANGEVDGEVVFVGFCMKTEGYDSFAGVDVKDKIVLALRYQPETEPLKGKLRPFAPLRAKAMIARERGAKALLLVNGPNSLPEDKLVPLRSDGSFADSSILAAHITRPLADKMLAAAGKNLKELQTALDQEPNPTAFALPNLRVKLRVDLKKENSEGRNIIAVLPGQAKNRNDQVIVVGAHYDHLGHGGAGSLDDTSTAIHAGADDNASGTAGVVELARHFTRYAGKLRRDIVFVLFSGEEEGLIGSTEFCKNPIVPLNRIVAMINMDMIGRSQDGRVAIEGAGSSSLWPRLVEQSAISSPLAVKLNIDPNLPTDSATFYRNGVPALALFTGFHKDYHRPGDTAEKINLPAAAQILEITRRLVTDLATRPDPPRFTKVAEAAAPTGAREGLRAYLGTIPDYTEANLAGVRLTGTKEGSPAAKAGMKAGDVIVKFGGKKITNIYDFTYALDGIKIGQPVEVVVTRDGKEITLTVVPEQRK